MSSLIQNIIIVGGILALMGFGYFLYMQSANSGSNSDVSIQVAAESANFLRRLNELKSVELNGNIFSDPRFISLVNYSIPVRAEMVGNPNPFSTQ